MAVGMANGQLSIRAKGHKEPAAAPQPRAAPRGGSFQYFIRGQREAGGEEEYKVEGARVRRLAPYDRLLKGFSYSAALDAALSLRDPLVVCSLLHELFLRDAARAALSGRDQETVEPVLEFLCRHMTDNKYTALLTDTATLVLDLYTTMIGRSERVDELLIKLRWRVHEQLAMDAELLRLQGCLELILTSAVHSRASDSALAS